MDRRRSSPDERAPTDEPLARAVDAIAIGLLVADSDGAAIYANSAWEQLTGQRGGSWIGTGWLSLVPVDLRGGVREDVLADARAGELHVTEWIVHEPILVDEFESGGGRVIAVEVAPSFEGEALVQIVVTAVDVTEHRDRVRRLVKQATRDELTGLYNRSQFLEFVRHALDRQRREPQHRSTLFFVDVDSLKATNDAHGHAAGDALLRGVASAIAAAVRPSDVVARYGGDEFTVLSESLSDPVEASLIAARIRSHVSEAAGADVSVGFATSDERDHDPSELIAHADRWMYRSRHRNGSPHGEDGARREGAPDAAPVASSPLDLIAMTAHELRTPLTAIIGFTATLRANHDRMTHAEHNVAFDALDRQANRLTDVVDLLLDLGRLRRGARPTLVEVDLHDVIVDALDMAPPPAPASVAIAWPSPRCFVRADRASLARLVVNLLTNAYRHGGPTILIDSFADRDRVDLVVEDDGPGVAGPIEDTLFEPFTRGTGHGGSGPAGSGLGLAIAREIARSFGGDLVHEPVEPHGARMRVSLPPARVVRLVQPSV